MYADDIVILSESEQGLQNCLNDLYQYCSNWKLQVNAHKSKIMVFNSNGRTFLNKFIYNNNVIETVPQYCYLGIILRYNGKFNLAINTLVEKARKAYFKLKKTITINNTCKLFEKLFDCLISPIMLYCCEVWGSYCVFRDSDPFENLHLKFIKEILGVHSKTSNDACRAELSCIPLKSKIQFTMINFLNHIYSSGNTIIYQIYKATKNTNPWIQNTKELLNNLGYSYIFEREIIFENELENIRQRIKDQNLQNQNSNIYQSSKLTFFNNIRVKGCRPYYVDNLINISERAAISKIRTSSHFLMIEKGRHSNIPRSERFCPACNLEHIETEEHFLLHCPRYKQERLNLENKLNKIIPKYKSLCSKYKLNILLNSKSTNVLRMSSSFIKTAFKARDKITCC